MGLRDKLSDIKKSLEEKMSYTVPEKRLHEKQEIKKSVEALFTWKQYQEMMGCSDDSKKEYLGYPTKEEYEENIKRIREKELHSDRFQKAKKFVRSFSYRMNLDLEKKFFKIVGTYGLDDDLINKTYNEKRIRNAKRYDKLKLFMNSLTKEQISSDLYLTAASKFMETSLIDCPMIIENLRKQIDDLEISDRNRRFEINIDIPKERLDIFPTTILETVSIPYYRPQDYKRSYVDILDEYNKHIYEEYNEYVRVINKIAEDIYHLQMWNLLSTYPEQIDNYYFSILNNSCEHQFRTAYSVKKCRESNIENRSKLEQLVEEKIDRPTYNLNLNINDIPMDEEICITIVQANEQTGIDNDGPTLTLRRNKINKDNLL